MFSNIKYRLGVLASLLALLSPVVAVAQTGTARRELSLEEARQLLAENAFDIDIARDNIARAQQIHRRARVALLPTLNIEAGYMFFDQEVVFEQGNPYAPLQPYLESVYQNDPDLQQFYEDNPDIIDARELAAAEYPPITVQHQHDLRASATLTQILFEPRVFTALDQTDTIISQAETGVSQVVFALNGALNLLYFESVAFRRYIDAAQRNLELAQINFNRAQAAFEEEVGSEFEMTRSEVELRRAENDLENAQLAYELSIQALVGFLVIDEPFDVIRPPELPLPGDLQPLVDRAFETRPELEQWDLTIELDEQRIDETYLTFWPSLVAQASANLARETGFTGDPFSWTIGVFLSWDIWDGGVRRVERQQRRIVLSQDETRLEQERINIEVELQQMFTRAQSQRRQVDTSRDAYELAQLNVDLTLEAWSLGAASQLEVDIARSQLFLSEIALAEAEVRLQGFIYELYRLSDGVQL